MNIPKTARAAAIRLVILAGILIAFTLFINLSWFDEELNKDLVALNTPRDVQMEGNAYPLFLGFLAAADRDPREAGLKIIRMAQERSRGGEQATLTNEEVDEILGHPDPAAVWQGVLEDTSCGDEVDCLDRVVTEATDAKLDNPRLRLLIDRFEQLLQVPRWEKFQELDSNSFSIPQPYFSLFPISRIRLGESIRANTTTRFLQDIDQDIRFWKRMLEGRQNLVGEMIAQSGLGSDAKFLSTLMRTRKLSAEELRGLSAILSPLSENERNMEEAFKGELRFFLRSQMSVADSFGGWWKLLQPAVQKNATANEMYMSTTLPMLRRASLSAAEFYRQRAYEPWNYKMRFMPPPLYNLGGKLLVSGVMPYGISAMLNCISRAHDLEGNISLVLLQAEVALNADRSVQDVVKGSRYRNPYTGEPMDYDSGKRTIGFRCLATGKDVCAVKIK